MAGGTGSSCKQRKTESSHWGTPCCTYRYCLWLLAGCALPDAPRKNPHKICKGREFPIGNFRFFVVCMMSLFRLPCSKFFLAFLAVPAGKDGRVECPRQTVNDFIGIRGSVCGLFLFVQTHAPLDICEQHTMCLISVSHIVMFAEKTYNAFEPVGHTKRGKERES